MGELPSQELKPEESVTPAAPGPEIPATGLPEPDYTPAIDLDKAEWQIVSQLFCVSRTLTVNCVKFQSELTHHCDIS